MQAPARGALQTHHRRSFKPFSSTHRITTPRMAASSNAAVQQANILVLAGADTPELKVLEQLPEGARVVKVGQTLQDFASLSEQDWSSVNVLLACGTGKNAGNRDHIKAIWPQLRGLTWMHSAFAGLDHLLFPELAESSVVLSNAKGVYSHSLAEYTLFAANYFAKDLPRLMTAKAQAKWEPYDVEELRGKTMGVIGYGDIGQACARLARAFRMRVVALRSRPQLSEAEQAEGVVARCYGPDGMAQLMAESDYVVVATPYTPATHEQVNAAAIAAMKPNAVLINVGRGKCVEEPALIKALEERRIRGAALDVFYTEPLPASSPLWALPNVLLSPHCADRTKEFQYESLQLFVQNLGRFVQGQELHNVCNKKAGY